MTNGCVASAGKVPGVDCCGWPAPTDCPWYGFCQGGKGNFVTHYRLFILVVLAVAAAMLAACGGSESTDSLDTAETTVSPAITTETTITDSTVGTEPTSTTIATVSTDSPSTTVVTETTETTQPDNAEPGCDWDSSRLPGGGASDVPASEGGDIDQAILGSWQLTHTDSGSGFEPLGPTTDIRIVLSADEFLYCQDVEGATDKAERSAPLKLEGDEIILPSPASGYTVTAWTDDTMVWLNHFDGSLFLLQRR